MKKFISNISSSTANAVNSAVKQIDKTLDKTLTPEQHAQPSAPSPTPGESKQYLRLPVDSAKKLRWYDKADVAALTRQHVREKHMLLDTITALKKVMIRAGFTDSALDEEARQLVAAAEAVRITDHGTELVLLLAVQAEVENLTAQKQAMHQEIQQLEDRLHELEAHPTAVLQPDTVSLQLHSGDGTVEEHPQQSQGQRLANGEAAAAADVSESAADKSARLLGELQASYSALQAAVATAANAQADVRSVELLSAAQQQAQQQQLNSAASAEQEANGGAPQQQQQQQDASSIPQQQQTADTALAQQPPADVLKRYREFTMQLEERCRAAERSASLSAARVASLEESLAAAQASLAAAQQRGVQAAAQAKQQITQLEERLRAAESAAAAASATSSTSSSGVAAATAAAAAAAAAAEQQLQQLAASRMQVTNLERRLAAVEGREASLMAELRSAEAAVAERDAAVATAAALREQLSELGREKSQLDHYKQRVAGLECAKADLESQLSGLATLVATLEARLRDVTAQSTAASAAAELAAATAAKAQAAVAEQVAARLAAAGRNRAMWPAAAQQEVQDLELRVQTLQATVATAHADLEACKRQLQQEQHAQTELQQQLQHTERQLAQAERDALIRSAELQSSLECCQADANGLRDKVLQLEQQQVNLTRQGSTPRSSASWQTAAGLSRGSSLAPQAFLSSSRSNSGIVNSMSSSPSAAAAASRLSHVRWQEQNKVGGGSLYGVADSAVESAAQMPLGTAQREVVDGIDLLYMKNVVLKFLEAVMAGKTAERDALLPAVAAVLQATPQEFSAMKKVLAATAPAGTQVMSMLGRLTQLAS